MADSYPNWKKTLWEKEKLLVTSNFSFSHSVFKGLVSQGRQKVSLLFGYALWTVGCNFITVANTDVANEKGIFLPQWIFWVILW